MRTQVLFVLLVYLSGSAVSYTLEECEQYDLSSQCYYTLENKILSATVQIKVCQAIQDYIGCIETVGCDCNMTVSYDLNTALTSIEHYYETNGCVDETGPLLEKNGIPCDKWSNSTNTTHGELLELQFSAAQYVIELDKNCTGVQTCYAVFDAEGALAIHNRNMSELCLTMKRLILCLDNAVCGCNANNESNVFFALVEEDYFYRQTCSNVNVKGHDMIPRLTMKCHANGTAAARTICDTSDPSYKCYMEYEDTLFQFGESFEAICPATKRYIECTEEVACECGLVRDYAIYQALTSAVNYYNSSGCLMFSAPITITPGISCPDGSGTKEDEDRIIIETGNHPAVELQDKWCSGIKKCYKDFDEGSGMALFEKNNLKLCQHNKVFVECVELTYCQCGVYTYENTSRTLSYFRENHEYSCSTDAVLRTDFQCHFGKIGFKCTDDRDCVLVPESECKETKVCACKPNMKYIPANMTCTIEQVSGAYTPVGLGAVILLGLVSLLVSVMME